MIFSLINVISRDNNQEMSILSSEIIQDQIRYGAKEEAKEETVEVLDDENNKIFKSDLVAQSNDIIFLQSKLDDKKIINNFDDSTDNFKTVKKNSNQLDLYRFRLALVEVDIAKATIRAEKKSALKKLVHAKKIFNELGKTTEAKFAQQLINQIDYRY